MRGLRVRFEGGRAVEVDGRRERGRDPRADRVDEGAARLGELALVDRQGRIGPARHDLLRHAARRERRQPHRARLRLPVRGRRTRTWPRVNQSEIHIDFMIGSPELDVTGVTRDGRARARAPRRRLAGARPRLRLRAWPMRRRPYDCAHGAAAQIRDPARTGSTRTGKVWWNLDDAGPLHRTRWSAARACSPTAARSSSTRAGTPAARPSDKFVVRESRLRGPHLVGQGEPAARGGALRRAARRRSSRTSTRARPVRDRRLRRRRSRAPASPSASSPTSAYHALFARTMFITPSDEELTHFEPEAVVLHAPGARGRPRRGRHADRHVHRAAPVAPGGADRRHVLRRRDQEVDLHADERPAAARGRAPDALLGERRRRRATSRSSSASRAPARRRSRPTRSGS